MTGRVGAVALGVTLSACFARVEIPKGAQITCANTSDCPAGHGCVEALCVAFADGCLSSAGEQLADGTVCAESRICVGGRCTTSACGDGFIDRLAGEQCEQIVDPRCSDACTAPFCGDEVVDRGETCDVRNAGCIGCVRHCDVDFTADFNVDPTDACERALVPIGRTTVPAYYESVAVTADGLWLLEARLDADDEVVTDLYYHPGLFGLDPATPLVPIRIAEEFLFVAGTTDGRGFALRLGGPSEHSVFSLDAGGVMTERLDLGRDLFGLVWGDGLLWAQAYSAELLVGIDPQDWSTIDTPAGACARTARFSVCASQVLCLDGERDGVLLAMDRATLEVRDLAEGSPSFGCAGDGRAMWHDGSTLFVDGLPTQQALAEMPSIVTTGERNSLRQMIPLDAETVIMAGATRLGDDVILRFSMPYREFTGIAFGDLLAHTPTVLVVGESNPDISTTARALSPP